MAQNYQDSNALQMYTCGKFLSLFQHHSLLKRSIFVMLNIVFCHSIVFLTQDNI